MPDGRESRQLPLACLRTFLVLLVVAHHGALAYHSYAPRPPEPMQAASLRWTAFPVVDAEPSPAVAVFVAFNDVFFMSLLFLISGVFVWPSLARKGAARFLRDRALRLGLPFVVAAAVLGPLAYYPTYLLTTADPRLPDFARTWLALGVWPAGPVWFLWVLLAFGGVAAGAFAVAPGFGVRVGSLSGRLSIRPQAYSEALVVASAIAYLPLALTLGPGRWVSAGPFWIQIARVLQYLLYFFAGIGLGAYGRERGLLAPDGTLARRWSAWVFAALVAFGLFGAVLVTALPTFDHPSRTLLTLGSLAFVLSCAGSSFACLAVFTRFVRSSGRVLDSLNANSYAIFVLHFACVTWLQVALLDAPLAGAVKALLVFLGAVAVSWSAGAALRRVPAIAAIL